MANVWVPQSNKLIIVLLLGIMDDLMAIMTQSVVCFSTSVDDMQLNTTRAL